MAFTYHVLNATTLAAEFDAQIGDIERQHVKARSAIRSAKDRPLDATYTAAVQTAALQRLRANKQALEGQRDAIEAEKADALAAVTPK